MSGPELIGGTGVVVALATFVFVGFVAVATRPRTPRPGPQTMDLGEEAPAVVDLLTDGFEPTSESVPATLLDLAARRWLTIEQYGDRILIRRRSGATGALRPFERTVLEHLQGLAIDGVVPAAAMTTGPEAASARWWKRFRRAVVDDARAAGLCRPRWAGTSVAAVWLGAAAALGCAWLANSVAGESPSFRTVDALAVTAGGAAFALVAVAMAITSSDRQRDTAEGLAAAGRWVGVREFLAEHADFATKPAAAVAVWDRYLAHAAALDLAPLAVAQLPLGAEDDRHAWSRVTGQWRHVTVSYPRLRPGYGQHPALAALLGLVAGAAALRVLGWLAPVAAGSADLLDDVPDAGAGWVRGVGSAVAAVAALVAAWSVLKLVMALSDVFASDTVDGVLLRARVRETGDRWPGPLRVFRPQPDRRRRRYYVAVDDGAAGHIRAWRIRPRLHAAAEQGDEVTVVVTPRLGYIRSLERARGVPRRGRTAEAAADDPALVAAAQTMAAGR